jgi:ABC-type transport system involved in multi-copper enzyme maturation permease subunit
MNTWVIARNTFGDSLRKRVLLIFLLLAFVMLTLALLLNYFTAREQSTIFKSTQLVIILIFGALIAITTAVFLIPNEIERRTIYSILSKPVQRWEFFLGKFLGGAMTVGFMVGLMSLALMLVLFVLAAKPPTTAVEAMGQQAQQAVNVGDWMQRGGREVMLVLRGTIVIYFQLVIVTAIATTLSLYLTPTVNFSLTAFIWIVGNLQWLVSALASRQGEDGKGLTIVPWIAKGFYYLLPHFHDFNIMGSIVHPEVPIAVNHWVYTAEVSLYGVVYGLMVLLAGVLVFDRKEV